MTNLDARRAQNIGASECPALFSLPWGVEFGEDRFKPFETRFHLWQRKAGRLPDVAVDTPRTFWGRHLEPAIAAGIQELTGWQLVPGRFTEHPGVPGMSCTPDYCATIGAGVTQAATLEVKNVDRLEYRDWPERIEPGVWIWSDGSWQEARRQPPFRIKLQLQHQLACTGHQIGLLGALIGGNDPQFYRMAAHPGVAARIEAEVIAFWKSIEANDPPSPDWQLDGATIAALLGFSTPGLVKDLRGDALASEAAQDYDEARAVAKEAKERMEAAKAKLLHLTGTAERAVLDDGFSVSAKTIEGCSISYFREPYRDFRLTQKKGRTRR